MIWLIIVFHARMLRHMRMKLSTVKLNIIQLFTLHVEQSINYQNEGIYVNLCFL